MDNGASSSEDRAFVASQSSQSALSRPEASIPCALALMFLEATAIYFTNRDTGGEDRAHWANVSNAETCRKIARLLRGYHDALESIGSWHADGKDVFPDWKTTADALAEIADYALQGRHWPASAIETRSAETGYTDSVEDESAVDEVETPDTAPTNPPIEGE